MATESEPRSTFEADRGLVIRRLIGRVFEAVLIGATLVGVLSLVAIFALIGNDALGPLAAEPTWYLLYFAVLVAPMSAYTFYVRRRPAVAAINARSFAVSVGGSALALTVFAAAEALSPVDVIIYFLFVVGSPVGVIVYARTFGETNLTGPAVPVSMLVGLGAAIMLHGPISAAILEAGIPEWALYVVLFATPVAAVAGELTRRRDTTGGGLPAALGVVGAGVAAALVGPYQGVPGLGFDIGPSLALVLVSGVAAPSILLAVDTIENEPDGRVGLLGPALLVGGIVVGATLESQLGLTGLDTWLRPTLVFDSWSDFRPEQAGIYPQLVGSILIVGLMTFMAFPVGIGAAIYLEEYAPETGWQGVLADVLDVNISNLAGVPSVVYGLLGLALFRQVFGLTPGILIAASVTLGLLILPIVIVAAQEALRSVPDEQRRASYGLGASRWQTVRNVVLPEAVPGIMTGTILAVGRAIGETAPLVMIGLATTKFSVPEQLFSAATALPLQIFAAKGNNIPEYRTGVVAAASIVLLVLLLAMNATAILIRNKYQQEDN